MKRSRSCGAIVGEGVGGSLGFLELGKSIEGSGAVLRGRTKGLGRRSKVGMRLVTHRRVVRSWVGLKGGHGGKGGGT